MVHATSVDFFMDVARVGKTTTDVDDEGGQLFVVCCGAPGHAQLEHVRRDARPLDLHQPQRDEAVEQLQAGPVGVVHLHDEAHRLAGDRIAQ